jgi:hypothetical protein
VVKITMDGRFVAASALTGGIPWSMASIPMPQGGDLLLVTVDEGYEVTPIKSRISMPGFFVD